MLPSSQPELFHRSESCYPWPSSILLLLTDVAMFGHLLRSRAGGDFVFPGESVRPESYLSVPVAEPFQHGQLDLGGEFLGVLAASGQFVLRVRGFQDRLDDLGQRVGVVLSRRGSHLGGDR